MQMSYRPRLIKKASTTKHGNGQKVDIVELVCSNCGMRQTDSEFWPAKNHLKKCEEFKAPYVWTETYAEPGEADYLGNTNMWNYTLCCNGRGIWCSTGAHDKATLRALNDHQISPYQMNQTEWRAICFPMEYIKEKTKYLASLEEEKKVFLSDISLTARKLRREIAVARQNL